MEKSIGSYFSFELESNPNGLYYSSAIYLNTGRNALEYIIRVLNIKKIYLPLYSCDALITPMQRMQIPFEFYNLDNNLNPDFDYKKIKENEYFLYINYFGIKSNIIESLGASKINMIIDNSQAFFSRPINNIPTFYSLRKFFGVSDGSILFNINNKLELEKDKSAHRIHYLLSRIENEVEVAYQNYKKTEEELDKIPLMEMSDLTKSIYSSLNFENHLQARNRNFKYLDENLKTYNKIEIDEINGPLVYPLFIQNGAELKKKLIEERIFVATYWPNVLNQAKRDSLEYDFANNIISIPVDKRYVKEDMLRILSLIGKFV